LGERLRDADVAPVLGRALHLLTASGEADVLFEVAVPVQVGRSCEAAVASALAEVCVAILTRQPTSMVTEWCVAFVARWGLSLFGAQWHASGRGGWAPPTPAKF
jgi:hypothetical protein